MAKKNLTKAKKRTDPLELILKGERLTVKKRTRRGDFEITFPLPSDLRRIDLLVAERLEGKSVKSFAPETISTIRVYATLDVVISNAPKWWTDLNSAEECADDDLITNLYRSYLRHYKATQELLSKGRFGNNVGQVRMEESANAVDDGAFSNIAHG